MRAMKRTVSILLALVLVLGMATMGVSVASAAETNTVTFTSNIGVNGTVDYTPGTTETVTVTYELQTDLGIVNTQGKIYFDNKVLEPANANVLPNLSGVSNNVLSDHITFTASSFTPADFSTKKPFVQVVFNVKGSGNTTVRLDVEYLTGNTATGSTTSATDVDIVADSTADTTKFTATGAGEIYPEETLADISNFLYTYSSYLAGNVSLTHRFYKSPKGGYKAADLQVRFSGPLDDENVTIDYTKMDSAGSSLYEHKYALYSAMFTQPVTCEILQNGKVIAKNTYSIEEYVIDNLPKTTNTKLADLYKALLTFGAKAQVKFNKYTDSPADARLDYTMPTVAASDIVLPAGISTTHPDVSALGLSFYRESGEYLAATSLKVQLRRTSAAKFATASVTVNGEEAAFAAANSNGSLQQVAIEAIPSPLLDEVYTITYSNGAVYKTSILAQVKSKLAEDPSDEFFMAVYLYNQAANVYFNK